MRLVTWKVERILATWGGSWVGAEAEACVGCVWACELCTVPHVDRQPIWPEHRRWCPVPVPVHETSDFRSRVSCNVEKGAVVVRLGRASECCMTPAPGLWSCPRCQGPLTTSGRTTHLQPAPYTHHWPTEPSHSHSLLLLNYGRMTSLLPLLTDVRLMGKAQPTHLI